MGLGQPELYCNGLAEIVIMLTTWLRNVKWWNTKSMVVTKITGRYSSLPLCLPWRHALHSHSFLNSAWNGGLVASLKLRPLYLRGNSPAHPFHTRLWGPPSASAAVLEKKKSCPSWKQIPWLTVVPIRLVCNWCFGTEYCSHPQRSRCPEHLDPWR